MMRSLFVSGWVLMLLVWGCRAPVDTGGPSPDFEAAWNAPSADSQVAGFDPPARPRDEGMLVPVGNLDSLLGFRLRQAEYRVQTTGAGFVVVDRDSARLIRFDTLGNRVAVTPMTGVGEAASAAVCVDVDSALVIGDANLYNQPRRFIWLDLSAERTGGPVAIDTLNLPADARSVGCRRLGSQWLVLVGLMENVPGQVGPREVMQLYVLTPGRRRLSAQPALTLRRASPPLVSPAGVPFPTANPWGMPLAISADGEGRIFVLDGPQRLVSIVDGDVRRVRGLVSQPRALTAEAIDSFARARSTGDREGMLEMASAAERAQILATADSAYRSATAGVAIPEVVGLWVGNDGSFAVASSEFAVTGRNYWDLFTADGTHLGGVFVPPPARVVGVQSSTLWVVHPAADSAAAPSLVRVRPSGLQQQ